MRRPILFLCVANSARSQMAEGLARSMAPAGQAVYSAGSSPTTPHPLALRALAEVGVDASAQRSKGLDEVPLGEVGLVVTLCADEVCPVLPGAVERRHWPLPDPAAPPATLDAFRAVRDELTRRLQALLDEG